MNSKKLILRTLAIGLCFGICAPLSNLGDQPAKLNGKRKFQPSRGLVAYYSFDGNSDDQSGNGHHGVVYGASLAADRFGQPGKAYAFGQSLQPSHIQIDSLTSDYFLNDFTISCWLSVDVLANPYNYYFCAPDSGFDACIFGAGYSPEDRLGWLSFMGGGVLNQPLANMFEADASSLANGQWFQAVLVKSGGTFKMYFNGMDASASGNLVTGNPDYVADQIPFSGLLIGGATSAVDPGRFFVGKIDEFRIYDRALSASDVERLFIFETNSPKASR